MTAAFFTWPRHHQSSSSGCANPGTSEKHTLAWLISPKQTVLSLQLHSWAPCCPGLSGYPEESCESRTSNICRAGVVKPSYKRTLSVVALRATYGFCLKFSVTFQKCKNHTRWQVGAHCPVTIMPWAESGALGAPSGFDFSLPEPTGSLVTCWATVSSASVCAGLVHS